MSKCLVIINIYKKPSNNAGFERRHLLWTFYFFNVYFYIPNVLPTI